MLKGVKRTVRKSKLLKPLFNKYKEREFSDMFARLKTLADRCRENNVELVLFTTPDPDEMKGLSADERDRLNNWTLDFNNVTEADMAKLDRIYPDGITREYIDEVYSGTVIVNLGYKKTVADYAGDKVNFKSGIRLTTGTPDKYSNKICVFGACTARGTGVEDSKTIPSYLQAKINNAFPKSYCVENLAIGCGSTLTDDINVINSECFKNGDVIVIISHLGSPLRRFAEKIGVKAFGTSQLFDTPMPVGSWFTDETYHTNEYGNEIIAGYIFDKLCSEKCVPLNTDAKKSTMLPTNKPQKTELMNTDDFKKYAQELELHRCEDYLNKKCGAIVMNCNPFTLGHRFLIETAAAQVDQLYIFVVEENKSAFSYEDRFDLVKKGTADLANVCVLPSGRFIISALTFPGYFYKDNNNEAIVDTSNDVDVFALGIAPVLNIKVRFAGEEPLDMVTRQYNHTMSERLPLNGIEFCEIKRKEQGSGVISASRVRKAIKENDWDTVAQLVPSTTYEYLVKRFGGKNEQ